MATLVITRRAANDLGMRACAQLSLWGETPRRVTLLEEGAAIGFEFEIISAEPKWRKAFQVSPSQCGPEQLWDQINAWREKVRGDLRNGVASTIVRSVIQAHGIEAVSKALEHRSHD